MLKACCHAQHDFFWSLHPQPTPEDKMPKREASHELDMKRKRQAERSQRQDVSSRSAGASALVCLAAHVVHLRNPVRARADVVLRPAPSVVPELGVGAA